MLKSLPNSPGAEDFDLLDDSIPESGQSDEGQEFFEHFRLEVDPGQAPVVTWRAHANLLFCNWLNYFVYQTTPYDLSMIPEGVETVD